MLSISGIDERVLLCTTLPGCRPGNKHAKRSIGCFGYEDLAIAIVDLLIYSNPCHIDGLVNWT